MECFLRAIKFYFPLVNIAFAILAPLSSQCCHCMWMSHAQYNHSFPSFQNRISFQTYSPKLLTIAFILAFLLKSSLTHTLCASCRAKAILSDFKKCSLLLKILFVFTLHQAPPQCCAQSYAAETQRWFGHSPARRELRSCRGERETQQTIRTAPCKLFTRIRRRGQCGEGQQ